MSFANEMYIAALDKTGISYKTDCVMSAYTTFRIGGAVAYAVFPQTQEQLRTAVRLCRTYGVACALVGCGSNLLWDDEPFDGCVIFTTAMTRVWVDGTHITADAGASLSAVTVAARDAGLSGLSFAHGIPGSVGGAIFMNAGAYDGEIGDVTAAVTYFDLDSGEIVNVSHDDCAFAYRTSAFQNRNGVILSATFALRQGETDVIRAEMEDYLSRRREKQPLGLPNAGSAFKRYPGYFTAKLIDDAGLKGYAVGGAQVSEKHAGFIVNRGGATAHEVRTLIEAIRQKIFASDGILIEPEIRETKDCIL